MNKYQPLLTLGKYNRAMKSVNNIDWIFEYLQDHQAHLDIQSDDIPKTLRQYPAEFGAQDVDEDLLDS